MKIHTSNLIPRMIRAGLRLDGVRYRVIACGIDNKNRIISIRTNIPFLPNQGRHAEERVIHSSPRSLSKIIIIRINSRGNTLPIHPCERCYRLARSRHVIIESPMNRQF